MVKKNFKVTEKVTTTKIYKTFDGKIFKNIEDAKIYTRLNIIKHYFDEFDIKIDDGVLEFIESKFDHIVNDFYIVDALTEGFGTKDDF